MFGGEKIIMNLKDNRIRYYLSLGMQDLKK